MKYYTVSGTFLGKPFIVRDVQAKNLNDAQDKIRNIIKFDEPQEADWSDNTIFDFFNGLVRG
jgi:hypothetical protein